MQVENSLTSHGSLMFKDNQAEVPLEGQRNPLVIYDDETKEVGLVITPEGEVRLYSQDVITKWAKTVSAMMEKLNRPPTDMEFITDSDPGDEHPHD